MGNAGYFPNLWAINYTAGFPCGEVPYDVIAVVSKMACFYPLNIAGDLVGGIAIASKSIGIDGLSQSINTTSCVHPDVLIGSGANARKISEVGIPTIKWDGNLVAITVEDKENLFPLLITPDHFVLTNFGWVESDKLLIGDLIDQGDRSFRKVVRKNYQYFKGQLYDILNQPEEKYVTIQGVIHNSPENAGYSARLREYERELKVEIPRLVGFYKGIRMAVG